MATAKYYIQAIQYKNPRDKVVFLKDAIMKERVRIMNKIGWDFNRVMNQWVGGPQVESEIIPSKDFKTAVLKVTARDGVYPEEMIDTEDIRESILKNTDVVDLEIQNKTQTR